MYAIVHSRLVRFLLLLAVLTAVLTVLAVGAADFGSRMAPAGASSPAGCRVVVAEADLGPTPTLAGADYAALAGENVPGVWLSPTGEVLGWAAHEDAAVYDSPGCAVNAAPYPGRWRLLGPGPR